MFQCFVMFGQTLFALSFAHEKVLGVRRHVQPQRERKVGVDLLLHHCHHVEGVSHGVETEDPWQLFETRSERREEGGIKTAPL